jgi:hypothetical protein
VSRMSLSGISRMREEQSASVWKIVMERGLSAGAGRLWSHLLACLIDKECDEEESQL